MHECNAHVVTDHVCYGASLLSLLIWCGGLRWNLCKAQCWNKSLLTFDLWLFFTFSPPSLTFGYYLCQGQIQGEGAGVAHPPPPWEKTVWFIGVEVEQETSTPPPKKNPGSAPKCHIVCMTVFFSILTGLLYFWVMVCCPWWWYKLLQPSQLNHRYEM